MFKARFVAPLILILCVICACEAPEPGLYGTVLDEAGKPLSGVKVKIAGTEPVVKTNAQGQFLLGYEPGDLRVLFELEDYRSKAVPLRMQTRTRYDMGSITLTIDRNEEAVRTTVLEIVAAQINYQMSQEPPSYAPSLQVLTDTQNDQGRPYLKRSYAEPKVGGSLIQFEASGPDEEGVISSFQIRTKPVRYPESGNLSFFADEKALRKGDNGGDWGTIELPEEQLGV